MSQKRARLYGTGRTDWEAVRNLAGSMTCAWADYDGFQVGPCPDQAPPTSHLWGWDETRRIRVRFDASVATAALLDFREGPVLDLPHRVDDVAVSTSLSVTWHFGEPRIGQQAAAALHGPVELMTVSVESDSSPMTAALTFVSPRT